MANINFLVHNIINTWSRDKVVRINKMFTKGKILWSFIKFSPIILKGNVWRSVRRICLRILGIKRLTLPECLSLNMGPLHAIHQSRLCFWSLFAIENQVSLKFDVLEDYRRTVHLTTFIFSVFPLCLVRKSSTKLTTNLPSVIHSLFPVLGISWSEGHFHIVSHFSEELKTFLQQI